MVGCSRDFSPVSLIFYERKLFSLIVLVARCFLALCGIKEKKRRSRTGWMTLWLDGSITRGKQEGGGKWRMAAWFNEKPRLRDRSPFLAAWKSYRINPSPRLNSQKFAQFDHANRISRSNRSASVRASGRAVSVLTPARRLPVQSRIINNVWNETSKGREGGNTLIHSSTVFPPLPWNVPFARYFQNILFKM